MPWGNESAPSSGGRFNRSSSVGPFFTFALRLRCALPTRTTRPSSSTCSRRFCRLRFWGIARDCLYSSNESSEDPSPTSGGTEVGRERGGKFSSAERQDGHKDGPNYDRTAYHLHRERRKAQSHCRKCPLRGTVAEAQHAPTKKNKLASSNEN